ncbi:MAG: integrase [Gemmatimonadales bacterium]|nr:integrase [Gemmatimonadales bacterium]
MIDIVEVLTHWRAGRSQNEMASSLGLDRGTIRKYTAPAIAEGIVAGGEPLGEVFWRERIAVWFPELTDQALRRVTWPEIARHRDYVVAQLAADVTVTTIHQRLCDEYGLAVSLSSFRRWATANLPEEVLRSQVTVRALTEAKPGAEAQIDWGRLGTWTDPATGKRRTVQAFAMVLPCSRHMFVRPVFVMDQQAWTQCHVEAFAFFGGVPARLVPDNLKTGVDKPDLYDPKINRSYAELASHYGCLVDPARAFKPKDKGRVERPIPYIRDSFWRGRQWESLEHMRSGAVSWCLEVAGARRCRPLEGAAPLSVFTAVEAESLRPLPASVFVLATWAKATIGTDIHACVDKSLYSIPWRHVGKTVDARSTATMVQFFDSGELIKTHPRKIRGKSTDLNDYPPEKVAFHLRTPQWCRERAAGIGPSCLEVVEALTAENALYRLRSAQGVVGLADKHQPGRLEAACAKAVQAGDPSYRTIKGILAAGLEEETAEIPAGDGGAAACLHGPDRLFGRDPHGDSGGDNVIPLPMPGDGHDPQHDQQRDQQGGEVTAS